MFNSIRLLVIPAAVVVAALAGSATASATPTPAPAGETTVRPVSASTQGIIMRDGGICNPRWGC